MVKKRIIKKIVRKRNPDGTLAPSQVTTFVKEMKGGGLNATQIREENKTFT